MLHIIIPIKAQHPMRGEIVCALKKRFCVVYMFPIKAQNPMEEEGGNSVYCEKTIFCGSYVPYKGAKSIGGGGK